MQPTLPQSNAGAADMDLPAAQSMDWLFKKERIYLLAQFWQQRATLAEKEVNTLKEQLSSTSLTPTKSSSTITLNGVGLDDDHHMIENSLNSKLLMNNNKLEEVNENKMEKLTLNAKENDLEHHDLIDDDDDDDHHQQNDEITKKITTTTTTTTSSDEQQNKIGSDNEVVDDDDDDDVIATDSDLNLNSTNCRRSGSQTPPSSAATTKTISNVVTTQKHELKENSDSNLSNSNLNNNSINENNNSNSTRTLAEELAAKDKEISALVEEVSRLRSAITALQESHQSEIKRLEDRIDSKRQHITRLECRIDNESEYDEIKKENSILRSVDLSSPPNETKQFQELLLERTKALAAQTEALKSSNSDGSSSLVTPLHQILQNNQINKPPSSTSPCTPSVTPASTPIPSQTGGSVGGGSGSGGGGVNGGQTTPSAISAAQNNTSSLLHTHLQHNVEQFGSFLGEEIVSSWRRGLELQPPPLPSQSSTTTSSSSSSTALALRTNLLMNHHHHQQQQHQQQQQQHLAQQQQQQHLHHHQNLNNNLNHLHRLNQSLSPSTDGHLHHHLQQQQQQHHHHNLQQQQQQQQHQHNQLLHNSSSIHHDNDKTSSHHDASSRASTPALRDDRDDNLHLNGLGLSSMSLPMSKSPAEDNNNTLGSLQHPAGLIPGLPFQFQERGHFRFADDLQMPPGSMVGRLGDSLIPKGDPMEARLQEMLRYNMDKYSNQSLDTLHISRRVRELLSVHNIGQRLFAKYVLGLSQGTVSELLSKPKPWDKLTEKGRDSYRKMHAWGCDDNAVMLLKSLIPKKDSGISQYGRPDSDITDERIQHILGEAANLMKPSQQQQQQTLAQQQAQHLHNQQIQQQQLRELHRAEAPTIKIEDSHSLEDSKSPPLQCTSPFSKEAQLRKMKKYDNDDIPQEKVARIYNEELAKLMSRGPPNGGMPPNAQTPDDNIRLAFEAYHRELAKLQGSGANLPNFPNFPNFPGLLALQQQVLNGAQDLSLPKEKEMKMNGQQSAMSIDCDNSKDGDDSSNRHSGSAFSLVRPKTESNPTPTTTASSAPSPIGNSILPPAITPTDDFSSAASPLQRMASITNSLISQPPVTPHHSQPQRPLKAVLPPITQQQFDMFNNLNTEDIVRRVKEALSQYSISQRLFGESVLGLSQGSVSDLLARPKPWHMLTQKGREPFIRMKMFLEDDNAVHKLVASQYKIAPEKLMRTGSYSGSPQIPSAISKQIPMMPKMMGETLHKMQKEQQHMLQQLQQQAQQAAQAQAQAHAAQAQSPMHHIPTSQPQTMLLTPPGLPPQHAIPLAAPQEKKPSMPMPVHSPQQNSQMRAMSQHMSPTVYEMAALTQDLDTQVITTKIKEALLANNIGQKIFGEAVLGLSQGSVSELLSKPKPWHMLSIKGREPFIRMQLWLADTNNVERLQLLKNERREANKRRRSTGPGGHDNSSDTSSNDTSEFYHSNSPGPASVGSSSTGPPNKKQRVLFSEEQKEALRLAFALDPYPNVATIEFLANELGLSTRTITNWFHNHRMRLKQQVPHGAPAEPVPTRDSQSGAPFDQNQFRVLLHQRLMELQKERMGLSGVPLPYAPYFAANPNLAALISRGLIPGGDAASFAALNAFKEQMSGLDLSLTKRDGDDDFDELEGEGDVDRDEDDRDHEEDSHISDTESLDGSDNLKEEAKNVTTPVRSSRRKPAAPQWVNPDWQDDKIPPGAVKPVNENEVIINGVCVMQQAADFNRLGDDETVRIEPTGVERFNDGGDRSDDDDDAGSDEKKTNKVGDMDEKLLKDKDEDNLKTVDHPNTATPIKKEVDVDSDRWEY